MIWCRESPFLQEMGKTRYWGWVWIGEEMGNWCGEMKMFRNIKTIILPSYLQCKPQADWEEKHTDTSGIIQDYWEQVLYFSNHRTDFISEYSLRTPGTKKMNNLLKVEEKTGKHKNDPFPTRECVSIPLISIVEGRKEGNTCWQRGNRTYWELNIELTECPKENLKVTPRCTEWLLISNFCLIPDLYYSLFPPIHV